MSNKRIYINWQKLCIAIKGDMSYAQLSKSLGRSHTYIGNIINGGNEPSISTGLEMLNMYYDKFGAEETYKLGIKDKEDFDREEKILNRKSKKEKENDDGFIGVGGHAEGGSLKNALMFYRKLNSVNAKHVGRLVNG